MGQHQDPIKVAVPYRLSSTAPEAHSWPCSVVAVGSVKAIWPSSPARRPVPSEDGPDTAAMVVHERRGDSSPCSQAGAGHVGSAPVCEDAASPNDLGGRLCRSDNGQVSTHSLLLLMVGSFLSNGVHVQQQLIGSEVCVFV